MDYKSQSGLSHRAWYRRIGQDGAEFCDLSTHRHGDEKDKCIIVR